ncbi:MAG: DUF2442 domain-containing protein [Cyanobacteria bacterium J06554_6]
MPGSDFIKIEKSRLTPMELWAFTTDEPLVKLVEFDEHSREFVATLRDGQRFVFALSLFAELAKATDDQLHSVTAINMGSALAWPELDVHYSVKNLIETSANINKERAPISSKTVL